MVKQQGCRRKGQNFESFTSIKREYKRKIHRQSRKALKLKKKEKILAKQREKEEVQEKQLKKKGDAVNSIVSLRVRAWLSV